MTKRRKGYSEEFQQQMIRLVRSGRTLEELGREFEPSAQAIRNWVRQAELDEGKRTDGLKSDEREELVRLRRENARQRRAGDPVKSRGLVRSGDREEVERIFTFMSIHRALFAIRAMCRVLEVSSSGYHAWCLRRKSKREAEDEKLQRRIEAIHDDLAGRTAFRGSMQSSGTRERRWGASAWPA